MGRIFYFNESINTVFEGLTQDKSHWERKNWQICFHPILSAITGSICSIKWGSLDESAVSAKNSSGRLIKEGSPALNMMIILS